MNEWSAETTIFSSSSVSSMVCMYQPILERTAGLVTHSALLAVVLALLKPVEERLAEPVARREHVRVTRAPRRELDLLHLAARPAVCALVRLVLADLGFGLLPAPERDPHRHILKIPKVVSGIGAFSAAARPRARTRRVSSGSMMPSSQSRAVE